MGQIDLHDQHFPTRVFFLWAALCDCRKTSLGGKLQDMTDWSHLQDIEGSHSSHLAGRLVGLAVCGSIACVETHRLARTLARHGAKVQIFLTAAAKELVSPTALAWATGRETIDRITARCEHLEYFGKDGQADLLLVAPLTANTLAKIALGLDDNIVTTSATTALGSGIPLLVAPGMHEPMMKNPAVVKNLALVKEHGVEILQPEISEGKAKMMTVEEMTARVLRCLGPRDLAGKRVLLTGGPTREFLDPARCLTNPSSGLTACLLAGEAYRRGADVTLVYGPGRCVPEPWIPTVRVTTAQEMEEAVKQSIAQAVPDFSLAVAAVSDFRPVQRSQDKIATAEGGFSLPLEPTPKILHTLRREAPSAQLISFKAASSRSDEELRQAISPYLESGRADLVVGNSIVEPGGGFDSETNRYLVCSSGSDGKVLGPASKLALSRLLWDEILFRNL